MFKKNSKNEFHIVNCLSLALAVLKTKVERCLIVQNNIYMSVVCKPEIDMHICKANLDFSSCISLCA